MTKKYQFRALSRKTLSYQKRQWFTNICCVGCCPFLMVIICAGLSAVVTLLAASINEENFYQFCSNENATDFQTGFPTAPVNKTFIDKDGKEQIRGSVNFAPDGPCVQYFGKDYIPIQFPYTPGPINNMCPPYFNPVLCPLISTVLVSPPMSGWFGNASNPTSAILNYYRLFPLQYNTWGLVSTKPGVSIGSKLQAPPIRLNPPFTPLNVTQDGLLGEIPISFYTASQMTELQAGQATFEARPYFEEVQTNGSFEEMNDQILDIINSVLKDLGNLTMPSNPTDEQKQDYALAFQKILGRVPYSALLFESIEDTKFTYTMQVGTNGRIAAQSTDTKKQGQDASDEFIPYSPFPTEGLRRLIQQSQVSQAIIRTIPWLANYTMTQGLRIMPLNTTTKLSIAIGAFVGQILYPFGVSFLLPVFVVSIVKEKEERILIMMKMNGLKSWVYYASEYVHFYILHIFSTAIFIITGIITRLDFFLNTDPGAYVLIFFIWGHTQIALAFFLSAFFSRSRVALIMVFCLVIAGVIISVAFSSLFFGPAPYAYLIYPPFAFYLALSRMNSRSSDLSIPDYTMSMMVPGDEVFNCVMALIVETVVLFLLAAYLNMIFPSEFGIQKPFYFIFTEPYQWLKKKYQKPDPKQEEAPPETIVTINEDKDLEDEDVKEERVRVQTKTYPADSSIVIDEIRKIYPNGKLAVKGVSLAIDANTVFGLLGPNGAGKTTLISILTGLYPPTNGTATMVGFQIPRDIKNIYMNIGVCPQHDILWDDLTVGEHLLFYARVKGVSPKNEKDAVKRALETVSLTRFKNRLSKGLSGGEKRRLSIAISLIGDAKVIFLDEPTTGLDPEVRRLIWDIINKARKGRTMILTTHSMEEAEVLCQRIGIMAKGTVRCLGPQVRLKKKYGTGFKIAVSCDAKDNAKVSQYLETILPEGWKKVDNFETSLSYEFTDNGEISEIFKRIEEDKNQIGIKFWGISQTSLEEVFLRIIDEADAEAS